MAHKPRPAASHADEGLERWLLTYADMITLLMAFFIMMYAMSIVNLGKFSELAISVRSGFGGETKELMSGTLGISTAAGTMPSVLPANAFDLMSKIAGAIRKDLPPEESKNIEAVSEDGVVTLRVRADDVLFARGSADLSPGAGRTLDAIANALAPLPHHVRVEGHTCDLPIHTPQFPSNWELSIQRAVNVVLYLERRWAFPPARLSAAGFADTVPLVPNTSEENRERNRRIDIVLLNSPAQRTIKELRVPAVPPPVGVAPPPVSLEPRLDSSPPTGGSAPSASSQPQPPRGTP